MNRIINLILVLASNLFPLYGLFFLGWNPLATVLVFVIETLIIFLFYEIDAIIKVFVFKQYIAGQAFFNGIGILMFSTAHFFISVLMFGTLGNRLEWNELFNILNSTLSIVWISIIIMFISHLFNFIQKIRQKDYFAPIKNTNYKDGGEYIVFRLFIMQFIVIFGGALAKATQNLVLGASLLVVIQTIYSLWRLKRNKL